ncbi:occludin, partial [Bacteroides thetaiotaomicron]
MKRIFFCIIILLAGMSSVSAQNGMPADTVRT